MSDELAIDTAAAPVDLRDEYVAALRQYAVSRGEEGLGAAYALGRAAVAGGLSILDLAEAHHACLGTMLEQAATPAERQETIRAAADFHRESLSTFEIAHRGYLEVQQVARLEHEHVEQLRALSDASLAMASTLTPVDILDIAVAAARRLAGVERANAVVGAFGPERTTLSATSRDDRPIASALTGPGAAATQQAAVTVAPVEERPENAPGAPSRPPSEQRPDLEVVLTGRAGRPLGSLTVVAKRDHPLTPRDQAVLVQLAQLASAALVNADLYGRQRTIAQTLQRSLLPASLPEVITVPVGVRFCPAGEGIEVGGDFYDFFSAGERTWAAVIGDVCGKGPQAASVTALARHTLRAAAVYETSPAANLAFLHRALREQRADDRFCTVAYARITETAAGADVQLSCAGHPPPYVVRAAGGIEAVGALGMLLGTEFAPRLNDVSFSLGPGDVLVLYTDGVTDVRRRRREVFGHRDLEALLETCVGAPPDEVADRVERAVLTAADGAPPDDVAVLAVGAAPRDDAGRPITVEYRADTG